MTPVPRLVIDMANDQAEKDIQKILDGILGEEFLRSITSQNDLSKVTTLQIQVNSSYQSLLDLNSNLPNLKTLVLDQSTIMSIRDLGVGLRQLVSLSLNACGLSDLDGIGVLTGLSHISLCDNSITDVAPLAMHENVQILDLSRNEILDVSIGDTLSTCPNLTSLKLVLNPICRTPDYRLIIASLISTLCILDDSAVDSMAFEKVSSAMVSEAASAVSVIREEIEDERRLKLSRLQKGKGEGGLSRKKNTTLLSNDDCHDYMEKERWTETAELQVTSSEEVDEVGGGISDTGSLLTHGSTVVLVGSMASAMRQRKRQSLHLQANDNNDYGGIVNEKDEEARSMISGSDCHSRCSTGRSREKDREEESALAVLDFALEVERRGMKYYFNDSNYSDEIGTTGRLGSGRGSRSGSLLGTMDKIVSRTGSGSGSVSGGIAFIGEGDITHHEAMRGSAILHKHALENANGGLGRDASCQYLSIDVDALQNHPYPCKPGDEMSDSRIGEGENGYDYDSYVCTPNFNFQTPDSNGILGPPQLSSKEISDKLLRVREGKSDREERVKKGGRGNKCSKNERLSIREGGRERGRLKDSEVESREEMNSNRFSPPRHKNGQRRISAQSLIPTSPSFYSHHSSPLANAKSRSNEGGLTGRLMTGRLMSTPSASFKIAVDNDDLEELRLRINLKNGPKGNGNRSSRCRSRGAVFGDLSLSIDGEKGVDENCQKYENNCIALQQQYISFGERNLSSKTSESESADVGNYVTGCTGVEVDINGTHSQDQEKVEFHNVNDYNSDEDSDNNNNNQRSLSTGGEREGERNREKEGRKQTETIVPGVTSSHSLVHRDMIMRKILSPFPSSSSSSSSVDSESHSPVQSLSTISSPSCRSNSLLSVGVDMIEIVSGAGSMKNRGRMVMDRGGGRRRSRGDDNDNNDDDNDNEDDDNDDGDEIRHGHGHGHGRGHGKSLNHSNVYADTVSVEKDRSRTTSAARAGTSLGFDLQGSLAAIGHWVDGMDSDVEEKEVEKDGRKVGKVDKDRVDGRRSTNGRKKVGESSSESENDLQTRERRVYGIKKKEQIFGSKSVERGRGDNIDVPIKILFKDAIMQMCTSSSAGPSSSSSTSFGDRPSSSYASFGGRYSSSSSTSFGDRPSSSSSISSLSHTQLQSFGDDQHSNGRNKSDLNRERSASHSANRTTQLTNITKDCNTDEQKDYSTTREVPKNQVQAHPQSKHNPTPRSAQRVTHDINISDQTNDGSMSPKRTFIETNIRIKNINMNSVSSKPNGHNKVERIIESTDIADFETRNDDENKNENEWERDFREKQDADTDRERERESSINSNTYIRNACISSLGFRISGTDKIDLKSYPSSPTRILDFKSSSNSTVTTTTTSSSTSSSVNDISDTFPTREKNNSQTQNGISSACVGKGKGKIKESTMKIGTDNLKLADVGVGYGVGVGVGVISGSEVVSRVRGGLVFGLGVTLSEEELIELLSLPPKSCPALRTKSGYQDFFTGMNTMKMKDLLEKGYDRMSDKLRKEEGRGERGRKGEKEIISGDGREDNESLMEANKEIEKEADVKKMKIKRRMDMLRGVLTN